MNFQRFQTREPLEMNLIPLIDVLLVILIFLMITTTYSKYAELQINLPTADAQKQPERPNEINITVNAGGQYTVNRRPVVFRDASGLADEMRRAGVELKDPVVVINADANATHQSVIHIMEASRLAGYSHISFATQTQAK
ncbi:MAG: biopolymer transporter ExbD [Betaproteobacteria bacterium]|nr:biopolymer transporter ExbD [Betaproteobacteria bacterium]OGA33647.1 MAG: biopolymer transporter ExbD [Betaproteobacteria bacterium RIFCSPLOWO2_12_FULL_64_23]